MIGQILVVEDEEHLARGLKFNLEAEGYKTEVAGDGETALNLLLEQRAAFDLLSATGALDRPWSEILDAAALAAYIAPVRNALVAAGGRPAVISSIGGKIVGLVGEAPPNLVVSQWPSFAAAQAWLKSPELAALEPQRAKAYRVVRQYIVETPAGQVPP